MSRDLYIAIMVASAKGRGLSLTADEVDLLADDSVIYLAALNGLESDEAAKIDMTGKTAWAKINPRKKRAAADEGI